MIKIKSKTGKTVYINEKYISSIEEFGERDICIIMINKDYYNVEMSFCEFKQLKTI